MPNRSLLIFASGGKEGGGSGFEKLVEAARAGKLRADIAGVVSQYEHGGVFERAGRLGIRFGHFRPPLTAERYREIVEELGNPEFVALSGWTRLVKGLDPRTTINIHPGPLPSFGGHRLHGDYVHEQVLDAFRDGRITHSAVSMHFVTEPRDERDYDTGPVFFRVPVHILPDDTVATLKARVNACEHLFQWEVTDQVLAGSISWDGKDPSSLRTPYPL